MIPAPTDDRGNSVWPSSMPDQDESTTEGGIRAQAQRLLDEQSTAGATLREAFTGLPAPEMHTADLVLNRVGNIRAHTLAGVAQLDKYARDDTLPDRARQRLHREAAANTRRAIEEAVTEGESAVEILATMLVDAAQPVFPEGGDRAEARDELRMLLDASSDPRETIRQLATGQDARLAALAASSFGENYLRARGVHEDTIRLTRVEVAHAALTSTDVRRRTAAQALQRVPDLRKQIHYVHHAASFVIPEG